MILRVSFVLCLTAALVLYIVALSVNGWPCGGLFEACQSNMADALGITYEYHVIGGLLIVATIFSFLGLMLSMFALRKYRKGVAIVLTISCFVAFAMGFSAEIYFQVKTAHNWSAFLANVALALNFGCAFIIVGRVYTKRMNPIDVFTPPIHILPPL